jgi:hypothetical protein
MAGENGRAATAGLSNLLFDATFQGFSMWVSDHGLDQASLNGLPLTLNSMVLSAAHADAGFAVQLRAVIDRDLRLAIWP